MHRSLQAYRRRGRLRAARICVRLLRLAEPGYELAAFQAQALAFESPHLSLLVGARLHRALEVAYGLCRHWL